MTEEVLRRLLAAHGWTLVPQDRKRKDGSVYRRWQARRSVRGRSATLGERTSRTQSVYLCWDEALADLTVDEVVQKLAARGEPRADLVVQRLPAGAVRLQRGTRGHGVTLTADEVRTLQQVLTDIVGEGTIDSDYLV